MAVLVALAAFAPDRAAWAQSESLTKQYQRGSTLYEAGMYEAATPYFARALALSEREYGLKSSRTGFILKNLATVYVKQRKFAEAEPVFLRALRIFEETFGEKNGLVAEIVSDLSIAYVEQKKFIQAEPLLARVMGNLEVEFGADDPRVAVATYNYAYASEFLGDASKAREYYARALAIWQSQSVPNDAQVKAVKDRLDGLKRVRGRKGPSLAPYIPKLVPGQVLAADEPPRAIALTPARKISTPKPDAKGWHVQFASFRTPEAAERESTRLQGAFSSDLASAGGLRVVRATLAKGTFYRVGVGPLADRESAAALCRALKEHGQACIVVRR